MSVYMNKCILRVCVCVCKCIFNIRTYVHMYIYIYTWIFIWYLFLPLLKNTRIFAVLAEKCRSWKKNAVVRNCQSTWSGIFAVWSGTFAVWSGIFAAEKRVWHQYIRRNSGLPKKVVFMQNLFIEQKAEIKPLLKRQVYIYILCVCGYVCVYVCLYIYIYST